MLDKLSYARSLLITAPLIFLYTGIMGSFSVASSLFDSRGRIQHACARIWARMILWTARVRVCVRGVERFDRGRPYVLCVNHQSHMDIPIILAALPFQFRFGGRERFLFRRPITYAAEPWKSSSASRFLQKVWHRRNWPIAFATRS